MASPAGTHAFLRPALWPHESMTVQKTWQRGFGERAGSRPLKCSAWQSHCLCCPLSHLPCSAPHPGCTHACFLPSFYPPSLSPCSDSRSLLFLLRTPQASCFPSFRLTLLSPAPSRHKNAGITNRSTPPFYVNVGVVRLVRSVFLTAESSSHPRHVFMDNFTHSSICTAPSGAREQRDGT